MQCRISRDRIRTGVCADDATAPPTGWTDDAGDGDIILPWNGVANTSSQMHKSCSCLIGAMPRGRNL